MIQDFITVSEGGMSETTAFQSRVPFALESDSIIIFTGDGLGTHGCELGPAALCHSRLVCPSLLVHMLLGSPGCCPFALLLLHLNSNTGAEAKMNACFASAMQFD